MDILRLTKTNIQLIKLACITKSLNVFRINTFRKKLGIRGVKMNILEALMLFDIENINNLEETVVKSKFRELIKKNHPDIGGDEEVAKKLTVAYEVIKKFLKELKMYKQISKKELVTWLIPFEKLSKIYMGEYLEVTNETGTIRLTRKNLRSDRVILLILVNIQYKGNVFSFENLCVTTIKDEYTIDCKLVDTTVSNAEDIKISAYDKEVNTTINGNRLDIRLSFDNLVKLTVHIERVAEHG